MHTDTLRPSGRNEPQAQGSRFDKPEVTNVFHEGPGGEGSHLSKTAFMPAHPLSRSERKGNCMLQSSILAQASALTLSI